MTTCTGCSLLCEDIELVLKTGAISEAKNLCRKGQGHFQALFTERTRPMIDGKEVTLDQAIASGGDSEKRQDAFALRLVQLHSGGQTVGINLSKKIGATIDDTSSFCEGLLMERILNGKSDCTLDDVRNFADTSVFWARTLPTAIPAPVPVLLLSAR